MKYLAIILATAGAIYGTFLFGQSVGAGQVQAEWTKERLEQTVAARAREHTLLARLAEQEKQQHENEQQNQRIIADSRAAIAGLRNVIAARAGTDNNPESVGQAVGAITTYRQLFTECTAEYASLAERADAVNLHAHGLLGYVVAIQATK